jgi:hypothetical protein
VNRSSGEAGKLSSLPEEITALEKMGIACFRVNKRSSALETAWKHLDSESTRSHLP